MVAISILFPIVPKLGEGQLGEHICDAPFVAVKSITYGRALKLGVVMLRELGIQKRSQTTLYSTDNNRRANYDN